MFYRFKGYEIWTYLKGGIYYAIFETITFYSPPTRKQREKLEANECRALSEFPFEQIGYLFSLFSPVTPCTTPG